MGQQQNAPVGQTGVTPAGQTGIYGQPGSMQRAQSGTEASIAPYYVGPGPAGQRYQDIVSSEYQTIGDRTTGRFADMFSKYLDVANREANRQASQIGEQLGSRGALYSSANLRMQEDLRQKTAQDIAAKGAEFQTTLEDQRQRAMGQVLTGQQGIAQAELGGREAAMARTYQDFIRRSEIPPWMQAGVQWGATRPGGGTFTF